MTGKLLVPVFLLLLPLCASAQGKIGFSYDAAGNRVRRGVIIEKIQDAEYGKMERRYDAPLRMQEDHNVRITQDAQGGQLRIAIDGYAEDDKCSLEFYATTGVLIASHDFSSDTLALDISSQPVGVYIVKVTINGSAQTWKITKR